MKFFITRHGETEENKLGILQGHMPGQLSKEGIEQAKALAYRLKDEYFDVIYSSDLKRVVDTTQEIMAYHHDKKLVFTKELRERDFGELTGKTRQELQAGSGLDVEPKQGESKVAFFARAKKILQDLLAKHEKETVLLVCHGGIGQLIIAQILGKNYEEMLAMEKLGNTSLSIFEIAKDSTYQEICYNSTSHLK